MLAVDIRNGAIVHHADVDGKRRVRRPNGSIGEDLKIADAIRSKHDPQGWIHRNGDAVCSLAEELLGLTLLPAPSERSTLLGILNGELKLPEPLLGLRLARQYARGDPLWQNCRGQDLVPVNCLSKEVQLLLNSERTASAGHGPKQAATHFLAHRVLHHLPRHRDKGSHILLHRLLQPIALWTAIPCVQHLRTSVEGGKSLGHGCGTRLAKVGHRPTSLQQALPGQPLGFEGVEAGDEGLATIARTAIRAR
mmetsp:Transcript_66841/g.145784  ORF Transcript_66841/g.145784 Transcript_66841/m.145784 type:complete len:251 (-) Transcript_66841:238-990(-)